MHSIIYRRHTIYPAAAEDSIAQRPVVQNHVIRVPKSDGVVPIHGMLVGEELI